MPITALSVFASLSFLALPLVMVWGWLRWVKRNEPSTLLSTLFVVGFGLATTSELLAISMVLYARISGGFGFYDPVLMRIYAAGMMLSLVGLALAVVGLWRASPLRWHAIVCTAATLLYWFLQAANE
ncbi:MAG: hypothetical protein ABSF28_06375 [Terracidiphilus sp.]|jgi:hypothetical protein